MTYRNPVIPGFHPDPSACRVGNDYYLATSSFTYFPGVPIFRSRDLVHWTQIGNAFDRPSQLDLDDTHNRASGGIFAPTLRHHDGRFWLITTIFSNSRIDNFFVTAEAPAGPWSDPTHIELLGIDPDLAWDEDGSCWVHYSNGTRIERCRIDSTTGAILNGPDPTWSGSGLQFPEAPHVLRRDGTWYMLIAEGGTERGHSVSVARGPSISGPWESHPNNPILSHRSTNRPIQTTGHADLIEAADGTWWMVLLGVRPRGASPLFHFLGRETYLAPVDWIDDWPCVAPIELDVDRRPPAAGHALDHDDREDFDAQTLPPQWIAVRRPPQELSSLEDRPGWLTLHGTDATLDSSTPVFVGRRQQHHECRARTLVDLGHAAEAGLAVVMDHQFHYEVAVTVDRIVARARIGPLTNVLAESPRPNGPTVLFLETATDTTAPDRVALGYEYPVGEPQVLAELDGRFLSTEVATGMLGRVIGLYANGGDAAFDWFDYHDLAPRAAHRHEG